jgi:hypothetical protein
MFLGSLPLTTDKSIVTNDSWFRLACSKRWDWAY